MKGLIIMDLWAATPPKEREASHAVITKFLRELKEKERRERESARRSQEESGTDVPSP